MSRFLTQLMDKKQREEKAKLELVPSQNRVNQNDDEKLTKNRNNVNQTTETTLTKSGKNVNQIPPQTLTKTNKPVDQNSAEKLTNEAILVNQADTATLTKKSDLVDKLTKSPELLTKDSSQNVNKSTKNKKVVNQNTEKSHKWEGYDKQRTESFSEIEGFRTSGAFKQQIKEFCAKNKMSKQDFYHRAAISFIESLVNQNDDPLVNKLTHDDRRLRTLYKTKPRIIHLYSAYAENPRWSVNDDAKASALNDVDLRIVELGILQTLGNRKQKGKINSFGYFLPEIENFLEIEMPEEGIEAMLTINRKSFQRLTGRTIDLSFLNEPVE